MEMTKCLNGNRMAIVLKGKLDAAAAQDLGGVLRDLPGKTTELVLLCDGMDYISSAGLRVLLMAQKRFPGKAFIMKKVRPAVMDVLKTTGLDSTFNFEE